MQSEFTMEHFFHVQQETLIASNPLKNIDSLHCFIDLLLAVYSSYQQRRYSMQYMNSIYVNPTYHWKPHNSMQKAAGKNHHRMKESVPYRFKHFHLIPATIKSSTIVIKFSTSHILMFSIHCSLSISTFLFSLMACRWTQVNAIEWSKLTIIIQKQFYMIQCN